MNYKNILAVIAVLIIAGGYFFWNDKKSAPTNFEECVTAGYPVSESYPRECKAGSKTFTEELSDNPEDMITTDLIQVVYPTNNELVSSPFELRGLARGLWYFEATFTAELVDADGNQLAEIPVMAQGDWMTEEFVPFQAIINFPAPQTPTGTLILHKANPSGDPEKNDKVEIPLEF